MILCDMGGTNAKESVSIEGTDQRAHRRAAKIHIKAAKHHAYQANVHEGKSMTRVERGFLKWPDHALKPTVKLLQSHNG